MENINLLYDEIENIKNIEDAIIIKDEDLEMYLNIIKLESEELKINKKMYTVGVNNSILLVFKSFKLKLKEICENFILKNRNYSYEVFIICNLILLFSPEFYTLYNIKKEIALKIQITQEIFFSEFNFVNILNKSNRKCSISWDYRLFLIKNFKHIMFDFKEHEVKIVKSLSSYAKMFGIDINKLDRMLIYDMDKVSLINEQDKRNYHLWKYIILIFNYYKEINDKLFIFSYCFSCFINNPKDYSAFSSSINTFKMIRNKLKIEVIDEMREYILKFTDPDREELDLYYLNLYLKYLNI